MAEEAAVAEPTPFCVPDCDNVAELRWPEDCDAADALLVDLDEEELEALSSDELKTEDLVFELLDWEFLSDDDEDLVRSDSKGFTAG